MSTRPLVEANFYLLGYYIACLRRYEGYCEQYEATAKEAEGRAALSYLGAKCRSFRKLAMMVAGDVGIDMDDISPDDRDAFLETINEMEGRSPRLDLIRHLASQEAFDAFVMGDYIGGEIGFVHEYLKTLVPEIGQSDTHGAIVSVLEMKLGQFGEYMRALPEGLSSLSVPLLSGIVDDIRGAEEDADEGVLAERVESFFAAYASVTDYYLSIRTGEDDEAAGVEPELYFISYAHRNRTRANQVELQLLRQNRRTWRDETDVRAGGSLLSSLYAGIDAAGTFVCLLSRQYLDSRWCPEELEKAVHRFVTSGRPRIAALRLDDCDIPTCLQSRLWLPASEREKLMLAIGQVVDEEPV